MLQRQLLFTSFPHPVEVEKLCNKIEYVPYRSQSDIDNFLENSVVPFK